MTIEITRERIHKAISKMLHVEETGFGLELDRRAYAVNLKTKGSSVSLVSYGRKYGQNDGAISAANGARSYFVDQISDSIVDHLLGDI